MLLSKKFAVGIVSRLHQLVSACGLWLPLVACHRFSKDSLPSLPPQENITHTHVERNASNRRKFGSQTSDNTLTQRWKSRGGKSQEGEVKK